MRVKLVFSDTMTGENDTAIVVVSEFTGEALRQAMESQAQMHSGEDESMALEAFVLTRSQDTAAFILRDLDRSAYGGFLIAGIAYTNFAD